MLRWVELSLVLVVLGACAAPASQSAAPPRAPQVVAEVPAAAQTGPTESALPASLGPLTWLLLGPFPNPATPDGKGRAGMARDFLASLGGESAAVIKAGQELTLEGKSYTATAVHPDQSGLVDLIPLYRADSDMKVVYAYAEVESAAAMRVLAMLGSDDSVAVWVNGKEVHRTIANRPVKVDEDRLRLALVEGKNRILLKVDNGAGGFAFAFLLYDESAERKLAALDLRRHLERIDVLPSTVTFLLKSVFPELGFVYPPGVEPLLGVPKVRWFDATLAEVSQPEREGRYVALVEAATKDGHSYRRMLTFAKLPNDHFMPWVPHEPFGLPPVVELPWGKPLSRAAHQELSAQMWRATQQSFWKTEGGAITALALLELEAERPKAQALQWFESGLIKDLEHKLRLRLKVEGKQPKPFKPPLALKEPARSLKRGSETDAGMKPGTTGRLRAFFRDWAKDDENPFVVVLARRGVVFMHEAFNGFAKDSLFRSASIAKSISGLAFGRAVEQGLFAWDQPLASVFPSYAHEKTRAITFRHCFYHLTGLVEHYSHGGLFDPFLDNDLLIQDLVFAEPGKRFIYNGDDINLANVALELGTGQSMFSLFQQHLQAPFGEPVAQLDGASGGRFSAMYLAKVGQMMLQDGKYGGYEFFSPGFLRELMPKRAAEFAPALVDQELENGIGLTWMRDPDGPGQLGALGQNVVGHGSAAGIYWRVAFDHELVAVVGRSEFKSWQINEAWGDRLAAQLAENIAGTITAAAPKR